MGYAWLQELRIDKDAPVAVYMQLRDGLVRMITQGLLQPAVKLPTSRFLATHFEVHRKTVVAALDVLLAEQWLQSVPRKGLFVNKNLPLAKAKSMAGFTNTYPAATSYPVHPNPNLYRQRARPGMPGFDDGYPDARLAPIRELGRAYIQALEEDRLNKNLSRWTPLEGESLFRSELARTMNEQRGLAIKPENILVTKGSQMSYYLVANVLLRRGDNVIVATPNYLLANITYQACGANLVKVGMDEQGMKMDEVEQVCRRKKIRCLDITSHHHHPTTVALSPQRRLGLLQLAQQYGFAIIEDEYDYDFHYENKPLMPLAAKDTAGHVVYIGSFSKTISHAFRVGYIIAPLNLIEEITCFRRIIDLHSDPLLEKAIGKLMAGGVLQSHTRKAAGIYRARRNAAYELFRAALWEYMQCSLPDGGLAFWSLFDKGISLPELSRRCAARGVYISNGSFYNYDDPMQNGIRMGFASMNEQEMGRAVDILVSVLRSL